MKPTAAWSQHCSGVESVLVVPGYKILFTASRDSTIKRWDIVSVFRMTQIFISHCNCFISFHCGINNHALIMPPSFMHLVRIMR